MLKAIKDFYKRTKFDFKKEMLTPDFKYPKNWIKIFFKNYPRFKQTPLHTERKGGEIINTLVNRYSEREFSDRPLSFLDISQLIYFSSGIKEMEEDTNKTRRVYPSAGARYPIELYLISNNISGLPKGLYHYNVKLNTLETLIEEDLRNKSTEIFSGEINKFYPNYIVLTGVMSRTEVKYGINAYRFALLECGHIGQNISLLSVNHNLGCCAIGGFDNDQLVKLLDIGDDEIPLYAFAIGNPKKQGH